LVIDFGLAWNWEYDYDLMRLLEAECRLQGLTFLSITPDNIAATTTTLERGELRLRALWDRAVDSDSNFMALNEWARMNMVKRINPYELARHAWNKATMHLEFITAGVYTPYTIILDPFNIQTTLREIDLSVLGNRFIIKPAHGGGGVGVIPDATSLERVLGARREHPDDYYLLQAAIEPVLLNDRPAWFRVIYGLRETYFCWWDVQTHVYNPFSPADRESLPMQLLNGIMAKIAALTGLDVFSSEIALTAEGNFVVVDYINDPLDLRLQSKAEDGVPDEIVRAVTSSCIVTVKKVISPETIAGKIENKDANIIKSER